MPSESRCMSTSLRTRPRRWGLKMALMNMCIIKRFQAFPFQRANRKSFLRSVRWWWSSINPTAVPKPPIHLMKSASFPTSVWRPRKILAMMCHRLVARELMNPWDFWMQIGALRSHPDHLDHFISIEPPIRHRFVVFLRTDAVLEEPWILPPPCW